MKRLTWFFLLLVFLLPGVPSAGASNLAYDMVSGVVYMAGFEYNHDQDIYMTRHHALQRKLGYNSLYDKMAAPVGMVIDVEPVRFEYNGTKYMIELWKGQYYWSIGAEIGFYIGTKLNIDGGTHYRCATAGEELEMAFALENDGIREYAVSGRHWWLTGFKGGVFAYPDDLVLKDIRIRFKSVGMAEAFADELYRLGYTDENDGVWSEGNTVGFVFSTPKSEQPWDADQVEGVLRNNRELVNALNAFKEEFALENFSPESVAGAIDKRFWTGMQLYHKFKALF